MEKEKWLPIKGYEGLYEVSNLGRIKSLRKNKMMSIKPVKDRYKSVGLVDRNGIIKSIKIHRLVAIHFIENPENKREVNHKNMNKNDNRVSNLEWVTPSENINHAVENKPEMVKAMNDYNRYIRPRLISQYTLEGQFIATYVNAKVAERYTGICGRNILQVANKEEYKKGKTRKQAGGYDWRFKND